MSGYEALGRLFGAGLGVSADGAVIAVGSPGLKATDVGAVHLYLRPAAGWQLSGDNTIHAAHFTIEGAPGGALGTAISVNGNGTTILAGEPGSDGYGRARYYVSTDGEWVGDIATGYLGVGDPEPGDEFGRSVAISDDDSVIVVGAPGRDGARGAVYVFRRPSGGWVNTQDLVPVSLGADAVAGDRFGESVAVSADGSVIVVGASGRSGGKGNVYLVLLDGTSANVHPRDDEPETQGLGVSVDISRDGTIAAATFLGLDETGGFRLYTGVDAPLTQSDQIRVKTVSFTDARYNGSWAGYGLEIDRDGSYVILGAPAFGGGKGTFLYSDIRD